jgi:LytS/YehU family sensor histidine kinase
MYVGKPAEDNFGRSEYFKDLFISLFLNVIAFYTIYFSFPRFIALKNKIVTGAAILLLIIAIMVVRLPVDWFFWKYLGNLSPGEMQFDWVWVWNELRLVIINGIYAVLIYYLINAIEIRKLRDELINQRQAGELALLKSQVNPHFLFNTLNNIYSLVYHKSDEAPEAVMKFSSIMRYVLHDANSEVVLLEKEVEYLRSYVELQRLRYKLPGLVRLTIEGKTDGIKIAPMLLIPFVENAFTHGSKNHQPAITVSLYAEDHLIRFEVFNFIRKNQPVTEKHDSGVGLSNIRRRLELIYPGKYSLSVREEDDQFNVNLVIQP